MYQKIMIIGRLGGEPEMRFLPDGTPVTKFSVATDRRWNDASGNPQQRTTWFRVSAWRKQAETCNQYLHKGSQVMVEGELTEPKPYQAKDGTWRASLDITAVNVKFLGNKGETTEQGTSGDELGEELPF